MNSRISSTVTKALNILDLFLKEQKHLTVSKISHHLNINMSTAVRLCQTLESRRYLTRNGRGMYSIGPQIDKLSQIYRLQYNAEESIRPILEKLRDQTGESASFYIVEGDSRVCLFRADSKNDIRHVVKEGNRLPLKMGVVGPVLLAFSGERGPEYDKIRTDGYMIAEGRQAYTASVSAPVHAKDGSLAGALVVSGLSIRFGEKEREAALSLILDYSKEIQDVMPIRNVWL